MELMKREFRRDQDVLTSVLDNAKRNVRHDVDTDRETMLAGLQRLSPGARFDSNESDRALAFSIWQATGRSLDEPTGDAKEPFRSRSDAYVIARAVGIAQQGVAARADSARTDATPMQTVARTDAERADARQHELAADARAEMVKANRLANAGYKSDAIELAEKGLEHAQLFNESTKRNTPGNPAPLPQLQHRSDVAPRDKAEEARAQMIAERKGEVAKHQAELADKRRQDGAAFVGGDYEKGMKS